LLFNSALWQLRHTVFIVSALYLETK
jgi:hypothetical protein